MRVDATGWRIYGDGRLQTFREHGLLVMTWVGWHRQFHVSWHPGALSLSWRRYGQ